MTFGPFKAQVVNLHDGDTIDVDVVLHGDPQHAGTHGAHDVDLGFNVHALVTRHGAIAAIVIRRQSVRLAGINAPELATTAGKLALAYLQSLVKAGDWVTLTDQGWDKYGGRIDGLITLADGSDLSQLMIAANEAAPWDGKGTKPVPTPEPAS